MLPGFDPNQIKDLDSARQAIGLLLNLVEELKSESDALRAENQELRDEINRLQGEQGKPAVKPSKKQPKPDHSSEKERRRPKKWRKGSKVDKITIDREETLALDQSQLPADAEFKGYEAVVVQDIQVKTDNVRFLKEKYYSASERQTYLAPLPAGYQGQFGPGLRALVITLYYGAEMTEPKIIEFLSHFELSLSAGQLSNLLTNSRKGKNGGMPKRTRFTRPALRAAAGNTLMIPVLALMGRTTIVTSWAIPCIPPTSPGLVKID